MMDPEIATGPLITERIILHMLEEYSELFKLCLQLQPVKVGRDHNPAHRTHT